MAQWKDGTEQARRDGVSKINSFLLRTRNELNALRSQDALPSTRRIHVMIGNEAADADSIVSSIVYAHFRELNAQHAQEASHMFVPVLPIPRDELALRCDVSSLFRALEIDTAALLFVDEFPWLHSSLRPGLRITLLDHNALNTKRIAADVAADDLGEIVEILDHHMDLGKHTTATVRDIAFENDQALVASCCTLVAERIVTERRAIGSSEDVDAVSATLLLAVIALDSINFNPSAKKVTPRDIAAAEKLQELALADSSALFEWLQAEKFNVAHWNSFSIANCLQCDYKEFAVPGHEGLEQYGVSAILIPLDAFVRKAANASEFLAKLQGYCAANHLAFLVVMTMVVAADGSRNREILFFENGEQIYTKQCLNHLREDNDVLQLEPIELPYRFDDLVIAFKQGNTGASRKQVVPLLQQALAPGKL